MINLKGNIFGIVLFVICVRYFMNLMCALTLITYSLIACFILYLKKNEMKNLLVFNLIYENLKIKLFHLVIIIIQ